MAQNDRYKRSRKAREKLGELICGGMDIEEAAKAALPDDDNRNTHIKGWKKKGVYPFGEVDSPPYNSLGDTVAQVAQQPSVVVSPTSVDDMWVKIERLVNETVDAKIKGIQLGSNVGLRPLLKKIKKDKPTSFRLPLALVERARVKATKERTSLNALVETFLFQYIGSPQDLLEE